VARRFRRRRTIRSSGAADGLSSFPHSWFRRFRKLLVRYEKLTETYEALLHMADAIIAVRKAGIIYG
jgi:hypothetical protein